MIEWRKLGDVCTPLRKEIIKQGDLKDNGQYPVVNSGISLYGLFDNYNNDGNAFTIASRGEYAGYISYMPDKFWAGGLCYPYRSKDEKLGLTKFIYEYLKKKEQYIMDTLVMRGGIPALNKVDVDKIQIPVPSLSEQTRIVGILDTFTSAIDNIKEQIAQRRKQYEYYRDQLLDLEGKPGVEMKTLGEIGKCVAGATPSTKISEYWEGGDIPWMSSGEVHQGNVTHTASFITQEGYNNSSTKILPVNTIVIALAGQGKTRGSVAITKIELCTNQSLCGVIIDDEKIINKYIFYYLKTRYNDLRKISSGDGARGGLNLKMIGSYPIPLPPVREQQRVVSILDTFEVLIQNLEAQLEQRQKQYEYYRNKLLTFE